MCPSRACKNNVCSRLAVVTNNILHISTLEKLSINVTKVGDLYFIYGDHSLLGAGSGGL